MDPKVFLRFDDHDATIRPVDAAGSLLELEAPTVYASGGSGAIPTYVGAGTAASGVGALTDAGMIPAGVIAGDILLLVVNNTHSTTVAATLSNAEGFAAIPGAAVNSDAYAAIRSEITVFWKRATGTDAPPTVADNGEFNVARIYAYRGCIDVGDPWDAVSADGDNDGDATMTMATGATTGSNRLVCVFVTAFTGGNASISGWTNASLANIVERDDTNYLIVGDRVHLAHMTGEKAAAGAYGATTATWAGAAYYVSAAVTIALKPTVAGVALATPSVVDGVTGPARAFGGAATPSGFATKDIVTGSTLFTRDLTIQAIVRVDKALQTAGIPGTIYARGLGTSAAEYHPFVLEVRLVNAGAEIAELRWLWQDSAGVLKAQTGGHFQMSTDFVMLTATRRWVSSTEVLLRYYLADELLAEVVSTDGDIGGGTTGTTSIGTRYDGAAWARFFGGAIDQLRILDRELAAEEIAMTWDRITRIQPNAVALVKECWPPGTPISASDSSRVQRENMIIGNALGFAEAQGENIRRNIFPTRAYGVVLEDWEEITKSPRRLSDDIDTRRRRVVGRLRQELGNSVPGVTKALEELAGTSIDNLDVYAFDPTTVDSWATLNTDRWRHVPAAQWTIVANALRVISAGVRNTFPEWYTSLQPVGGNGRQALIATKIIPSAIATQGEAGATLFDMARNNCVVVGYRNNAGAYQLVREEIIAGVPQGATVIAALGGAIVPVWIILEHLGEAGANTFRVRYSTTSAIAGFTTVDFTCSSLLATPANPIGWAGFYARTFSAVAAGVTVDFDDTTVRAPFGDRAMHFYVYRDPTLAGSPDFVGGNLVVNGLRHAFNVAAFVSTLFAKYDSADTTFDGPPMGGS
jgi:hypothetical protein